MAIGAVVAYHAAPSLVRGGWLGVDVFFVISGFLISRLILTAHDQGRFSYLDFLARRARRIFPALALVLAATLLLGWAILLPHEYELLGVHAAAGSLFVSNFVLWSEVGYFDAAADQKPLLHLWSLSIEEQFYLLWPAFLVLLLARARAPSRVIAIALVITLVASAWIAVQSPTAAFYLPVARFWELIAGAALAVWHRAGVPSAPPARAANLLSFAGATLIAVCVLYPRTSDSARSAWAAVTVLAAVGIIAAGEKAWFNRVVLAASPCVALGLVSYSLYLWHWPLLSFVRIVDLDDVAAARSLRVGALVLSFLAAGATYWFVERRVMCVHPAARVAPPLVLLLLVSGAVGAVVAATQGAVGTGLRDPFAWSPDLRIEDECADVHGIPKRLRTEAFCVRAGGVDDSTTVLIGDSHANALWPGVRASAGAAGATMIGASSCPYLRGQRFWSADRPEMKGACLELMDRAYSAVTPETQTVILAARSAAYVSLQRFGEVEAGAAPLLHAFSEGTAGPAAAFETALERELRALGLPGRRILLVHQVPELGFAPRRCIRVRPIDSLFPERRDCVVRRSLVESRQRPYREIVDRVVARLPVGAVITVDPMDVLCDAQYCSAMLDGTMMYRDDDHLSEQGAIAVWRAISAGLDSRNAR